MLVSFAKGMLASATPQVELFSVMKLVLSFVR